MVVTETDKMLNKLIRKEITASEYLRFQAERDLSEINARFETAMKDMVLKSGITKEMAEVQYWETHEDDYHRYQEASRRLLM